ncbi:MULTISPECIES: dihydrofolate reductase family protein [Streptomyces]|uniref:Dihydrofolate reductase n=1 Tax=Streptomyces lycii TaxID=2654337 RepID=A0ABQ7FFK6_9ACTN|nr:MULTISPECIES: dihydrofolate reductase family protein [Streptomyces]KAF4407610.1 dihydrofolate reductase [Streptomyces lycii]PGH47148.1 pyrimidine reductase [Streptomyces sp. Ru87]
MRELIVSELVTLDGVMEAPGGEPGHPHTGWAAEYHEPEYMDYKLHEVLAAETLLLGRVTYESFAGAWPGYTGEFADKMNGMPKVVVSRTLTEPAWHNTTVRAEDPVSVAGDLRAQDGGPVLVTGSRTLVHTLLGNGLVDELRLMVFPVTVGTGARVFPETTRKAVWRLTDTAPFASGVRVDTYRPA